MPPLLCLTRALSGVFEYRLWVVPGCAELSIGQKTGPKFTIRRQVCPGTGTLYCRMLSLLPKMVLILRTRCDATDVTSYHACWSNVCSFFVRDRLFLSGRTPATFLERTYVAVLPIRELNFLRPKRVTTVGSSRSWPAPYCAQGCLHFRTPNWDQARVKSGRAKCEAVRARAFDNETSRNIILYLV